MDNFEQIFKGFINQLPGCEVLGDVFNKHRLRQFRNTDYFLKNREIMAELKCLEQDSMPKLQEFVNELMETRGKIFYGEMAFDKYIKDFPDKEKLSEKAVEESGTPCKVPPITTCKIRGLDGFSSREVI